jgi:hypothetical protein
MQLPSATGLVLAVPGFAAAPAVLPTQASQRMTAGLWNLGAEGQLMSSVEKQPSLSFEGFPQLTTMDKCLLAHTATTHAPLLTPATMGTVTLANGGTIAAFLGVVAATDVTPCRCCRSVLFFRQQEQQGNTWRFVSHLQPLVSTVANATVWGRGFGSGTLVRLPSGTVMSLFSVGRCATKLAQSTTVDGVMWSKLTFPSQLWGSSPQLVSMSNGVLALSAGGPGLALWLSCSEGAEWTQHNIACLYNSVQWNITLRFDGEMRSAISPTTGE